MCLTEDEYHILRSAHDKQQKMGITPGEFGFTDEMTDEEVRMIFYVERLKNGVSPDEAKKMSYHMLEKYKKVEAYIDSPPEDASVLRIKKGRIIKKRGKFSSVETLNDIRTRV